MNRSKIEIVWSVDENGFLISPAGAKVARIDAGAIYLLDRRTKTDWPFSSSDWARLFPNREPVTAEDAVCT